MGLTLNREIGETIQVGDDVFITVNRIVHGGVRLTVTAPPELLVTRTILDEHATSQYKKDKQRKEHELAAILKAEHRQRLGLTGEQSKQASLSTLSVHLAGRQKRDGKD